MIVGFPVNFSFSIANIDKLKGSCLEVLLKLSHITSLAEQSFGSCAELILKNLFALKIGSFGTLHELVTVVLVTDFKVIKSIE